MKCSKIKLLGLCTCVFIVGFIMSHCGHLFWLLDTSCLKPLCTKQLNLPLELWLLCLWQVSKRQWKVIQDRIWLCDAWLMHDPEDLWMVSVSNQLLIKWFNPLIYRSRLLPLLAICNCYRRSASPSNLISRCYSVWKSYSSFCAPLFPGCSIVGMLIGFNCIKEPVEASGARQKKRNWIYAPVTRYGSVSLALRRTLDVFIIAE